MRMLRYSLRRVSPLDFVNGAHNPKVGGCSLGASDDEVQALRRQDLLPTSTDRDAQSSSLLLLRRGARDRSSTNTPAQTICSYLHFLELSLISAARATLMALSLAGEPCRFAHLSARSDVAEISDLSGRSAFSLSFPRNQ